jgi:hypothetical protein
MSTLSQPESGARCDMAESDDGATPIVAFLTDRDKEREKEEELSGVRIVDPERSPDTLTFVCANCNIVLSWRVKEVKRRNRYLNEKYVYCCCYWCSGWYHSRRVMLKCVNKAKKSGR